MPTLVTDHDASLKPWARRLRRRVFAAISVGLLWVVLTVVLSVFFRGRLREPGRIETVFPPLWPLRYHTRNIPSPNAMLTVASDGEISLYWTDEPPDEPQLDAGAHISCRPGISRFGIWVPHREDIDSTLTVWPFGPGLPPQITTAYIRNAYVDLAAASPRQGRLFSEEYRRRVRAGLGHTRRILWPGLMVDVGMGVLSVVALLVLGRVVTAFLAFHYARDRRLRGLCPVCKYDLRDAAQLRCPECGWHLALQEEST